MGLLWRIHRDFAEASRILVARVGLGRMAMGLPTIRIRVLSGDSAELLRGIYWASQSGYRGSTGPLISTSSTAGSEYGVWR